MPGVPRNPKLPTLSLDSSHIKLAYESLRIPSKSAAQSEWKPLYDLITSGRCCI
jgi:hypothetical protein